MSSKLELRVFVHEGGKTPQKGKRGDAGIDVFACLPEYTNMVGRTERFTIMVRQFEQVKVSLGFSYAFWLDGEQTHDYFLDVRNRSGVGTNSGMATLAEIGDANYRGILHYCAAKITEGVYPIQHGAKIAQAIINPFVDPHKVDLVLVDTIEDLGPSDRGTTGFGDSGA